MPGTGDPDNKLYIGGLSVETSNETLSSHFRKYGELADCIVMLDKPSNRSRGFGFVTFKDASSMHAALGTSNVIDGRDVSVKKAVRDVPQNLAHSSQGGVYNVKKVFVGGLPSTCDFEKLTGYFSRYGHIEDAVVMMDSQTQRHRGFGYVTFTDSSAVEGALKNYSDNRIDGKWVEVKRCIPQDAMREKPRSGSAKGPESRDSPPPSPGSVPMYPDPYSDPYARWYGGAYGVAAQAAYGYYGMYPAADPYAAYGAYGMPAGYPHAMYGSMARMAPLPGIVMEELLVVRPPTELASRETLGPVGVPS
eukprot:CAMPEP_0194510694 /NCGR_PEP_ID=MMETSP0253-20130528/42105_1 /TAXON_ID=2966 /ORGANISM="Noctiluca scintillans" /LENGTH=305 /DNA_ID=CAMNT_0039353955 /DNA_START=10 /DNA_END=925 /DNA_ORIENTATION=+